MFVQIWAQNYSKEGGKVPENVNSDSFRATSRPWRLLNKLRKMSVLSNDVSVVSKNLQIMTRVNNEFFFKKY